MKAQSAVTGKGVDLSPDKIYLKILLKRSHFCYISLVLKNLVPKKRWCSSVGRATDL